MKGAFTLFDRSWKFPVTVIITWLIVSSAAIYLSDLETGFSVPISGRIFSAVNLAEFLVIFLLSWLVSIPVSYRYKYLNSLLDNQQRTIQSIARFAEKIGNGIYDGNDRMDFDSDLGNILVSMKKKLIANSEKDRNEKWIAAGKEKIGNILRENQNISSLSVKVIEAIVEYTHAVQGAIYISEEKEEEKILRMAGCYAFSRRKFIEREFKIGEGLVGQAAIEKDIIHRTEIPDTYITIKSGLLGDVRPSALLIIPLVTDENLEGALELASFKEFSDLEINFFQDLAVMIARTIFNLRTRENTERLLSESTALTRELKLKQAQLEEHAGEMKKKQTLIEETNKKLEEKIGEVENSHKRQYALLENASEIITIFDRQMNIIYESPSVKNILGFRPEEIMSSSILDKLDNDSRITFRRMFNTLVHHPSGQVPIEFTYRKKNGDKVWMEGLGKNLLDDPAINGIIFNHRDITQKKIAEQEQIMRGKMQSLSENSRDMIIRFDLAGFCLYANPMVELYLSISGEKFLEKPFHHQPIDEKIKEVWSRTLTEVKNSGKRVETEMEFPFENGRRYMQLNAIPEYDNNQVLETVLLVSHDITDRKRGEEIIRESNRKITESINYAKRIQFSIIPAIDELKKSVRDASIWYQPKDVVSGDFPWILRQGNDIYFAAVDCTGHGVPGAMMSLIGYLLLNDVSGQKGIKPSVILDRLHRSVVKTLKQDVEGNNAADGMDIGICRYIPSENILEYAGAHRPLYHVSGGELNQVPGDKFPIGGNHYKVDKFTNHSLELKANDRIYIFSDGLTDQFGGPSGMKFGPKRVREKLTAFTQGSMESQLEELRIDVMDWIKNEKQIDDILIIGAQF